MNNNEWINNYILVKWKLHFLEKAFHTVNVFMQKYYFVDAVEAIFKIGSMSPGAMLYEASREFQVNCIFFTHLKLWVIGELHHNLLK